MCARHLPGPGGAGSGAPVAPDRQCDDGAGFTPRPAAGLGLASMRQRAAWLGGRLLLDSAPGRGTRLLVEIPLSAVPS